MKSRYSMETLREMHGDLPDERLLEIEAAQQEQHKFIARGGLYPKPKQRAGFFDGLIVGATLGAALVQVLEVLR